MLPSILPINEPDMIPPFSMDHFPEVPDKKAHFFKRISHGITHFAGFIFAPRVSGMLGATLQLVFHRYFHLHHFTSHEISP